MQDISFVSRGLRKGRRSTCFWGNFSPVFRVQSGGCAFTLPQKENGTQGEQRVSLFPSKFGAKIWHITHLKEQDFRVTITKTFWFGTALEFLPIEKANEIYTLAVTMNAEEIRAAFHAGVKLGVQLMLEVEQEDG